MAISDPMSYLTAPLREVALHHLAPDETVLMAIYAQHTIIHTRHKERWFIRVRQVHHPTRAFVLTTQRALIVEDPTDPVASTVKSEYLFASCALDRVMFFQLTSYLLDCSLTLVMATANGPERVTIEYNGGSENAFLIAVACMRAVGVGKPLPPYKRGDETYIQEREAALKGWHSVLVPLGLKQENAVMRYLVPTEHVQEWLRVPTIDESTWWQRFSIGAHEQPSAVLVRTDQQILLVKETRRIVRGQVTYGSEAWIMPRERLHAINLVSGRRTLEIQLTLEHDGVTEVVRFPVLPELAERVQELVMPFLPRRA